MKQDQWSTEKGLNWIIQMHSRYDIITSNIVYQIQYNLFTNSCSHSHQTLFNSKYKQNQKSNRQTFSFTRSSDKIILFMPTSQSNLPVLILTTQRFTFPLIIIYHLNYNFNMQSTSNRTLEFLTLENTRLKDQIEELKDMIRVNKESIDILSQPKTATHQKHNTTLNFQDNKVRLPRSETVQLKEIIKKLNAKNSSIMDQLFKLQRQNEDLRSKVSGSVLLMQQITDGYEDQEKRNIQMMESQLKSMSRNLTSTNQKLNENEKHRFKVDNISGLAIKFKQIYNPTEQAMKFQGIQFKLREEIAIQKIQIEKLKEDIRNLEKMNINLNSQLTKLKAALLMPNRPLDRIGEASIKKLALFFLEAQRKVLEGQDSDQQYQDFEIMTPQLVALFPDKVQCYKKKKEAKPSIPKIDLGKVRQLMNYNKKFVQAELKRRNNIPRTERIRMLQEELEFTRRQLTRALLLLKQTQTKNNNLHRSWVQLENRHKLIQKSYESMSKKMTVKNKNQLRKPDLNQTLNPQINYKNSPSYVTNHKPTINTKQTYNLNSPNQFTAKEQFRIQIYSLSEEVANLPFFRLHQPLTHNPNEKRVQKATIVRSLSNPSLSVVEASEKPVQTKYKEVQKEQVQYLNRYEQNLDDIHI